MLKRFKLSFYHKAAFYCFPGIVLFSLFWIYPFAITLYYSCLESSFNHSFVGIKNYLYVWNNVYYQLAVGNSIRFSLAAVPLCWTIALIIALFLEKLGRKSRPLLGFLLLPMFVPSSAVVEIWAMLFPGDQASFGALLSIFLWKNTGFSALLLCVGLSQVSASSREAAALDGARVFRQLFQIVLPQMADQGFFTAMLLLAWSMKIFRESYSLYGTYPPDKIYMVQNYINNQFTKLRYPNMAAASAGTLAIIVLITLIWLYREKREEKSIL